MLNENQAVAQLSEMFALELGYTPSQARLIGKAAELHDIGKVAICPTIINKPNRLTSSERETMKMHTKIGAQMVAGLCGRNSGVGGGFRAAAELVCLYHHEWWSGGDYWGVEARSLPIYINAVALVDTSVALLFPRAYKDPWSLTETLNHIQSRSGTQFSPYLVDAFMRMIKEKGVGEENSSLRSVLSCGKIVHR